MKKSIQVIECDNPTCDTQLSAEVPDDALGYYIDKASVHHAGGGAGIAKIFACKAECIAPAIDAVFQEVWDTGVVRKKW
jgi:hypothetical protein